MTPLLVGTLALGILALAAWSDARTRRIPNALCLLGWCLGVGVAAAEGAAVAAGVVALSAVVLVAGFALFARGILGAGDAKLLAALAAMVGPERFPLALLLTALAGVVLALVEATRHRMLLPVLMDCGALLASWTRTGTGTATVATTTGLTVPYGVAIAVGGAAAWLL